MNVLDGAQMHCFPTFLEQNCYCICFVQCALDMVYPIWLVCLSLFLSTGVPNWIVSLESNYHIAQWVNSTNQLFIGNNIIAGVTILPSIFSNFELDNMNK
ncbi:hypothetical protein B5X24_HaOG205883 [Helicoverpa armigera]|uniref:Uncharacterized protein n=1 Tax=Helicoverpa armigera TaxID=29058 RepID=A0A2W1BSA7_HELAM|nr:hypothetical protein B5X24_HaOG205883 [Helicoverpa armigera]